MKNISLCNLASESSAMCAHRHSRLCHCVSLQSEFIGSKTVLQHSLDHFNVCWLIFCTCFIESLFDYIERKFHEHNFYKNLSVYIHLKVAFLKIKIKTWQAAVINGTVRKYKEYRRGMLWLWMGQLCRSRWMGWRCLTVKLDPGPAVLVSSAKWEVKITSNSSVCRALMVAVTSDHTHYPDTHAHRYSQCLTGRYVQQKKKKKKARLYTRNRNAGSHMYHYVPVLCIHFPSSFKFLLWDYFELR